MSAAVDQRSRLPDFAWTALRAWGEKIVSFTIFVVLARILAPEEIGAMAFAMAIVAILQIFADGALGQWIIINPASSREQQTTIFTLQLLAGTVLAAGLCAAALVSGPALIDHGAGAGVLIALSIIVPLAGILSVPEALLRRDLQFRKLALQSLAASTIGGVLAIGLAVAGFGIWSLVWRQIVETAIRVCLCVVFAAWRPGLRLRIGAVGEALRYASVVLGSWIVQGLMHRADVFIIGSVLGVKALGFYAAALRIAQMVDDLVNAVAWQVSFPTFSRIVGNKPLLDSTYETLFKVTSWLQAPAIAILAGVAALLVPLLFGPQWNLSGPVLMWLLLLPLVGTMTQLNACLLFASNNAGRGFWLMVVGLVGTVIGSAIGSQISLEAAAIGTASRVLLIAPLGLWFIRPIVGLSAGRFGRLAGIAVGLSGAAFLGAAFGSSAIVPGVVARIAVGCSLGAALALGTFWLLARADFTRGLGLLAVTAGRMLRRRES